MTGQWVVIRSDHADDAAPAVDVFGPFDTATAALAWVGQQVTEDEVSYRAEPVVSATSEEPPRRP